MKIILILSIISIAIFACGDTNDHSPIIHHVETPEPDDEPDDYPEVPEGFPEDLTPVWLQDYFDEDFHAKHVILYRVMIELWNQGDHDFVNGVLDNSNGKVYLLYPGIVYVEWDDLDRDGPDGIPMYYIAGTLGTPHATVKFDNDIRGEEFTDAEVEEMMAGKGDLMAKHPGLKLVDYDKAGYKPKDVLVDYCNQPGNRARVPYCR